ncbi:MAG: hypothetical protein ACJ72L_07885 [Marmoricola sp.]
MSDRPRPTHGWTYFAVVVDGEPLNLRGVNPWDHDWQATGDVVVVAPPMLRGERYELDVCTLDTVDDTITFAAGEVSGGLWVFAIEEQWS